MINLNLDFGVRNFDIWHGKAKGFFCSLHIFGGVGAATGRTEDEVFWPQFPRYFSQTTNSVVRPLLNASHFSSIPFRNQPQYIAPCGSAVTLQRL